MRCLPWMFPNEVFIIHSSEICINASMNVKDHGIEFFKVWKEGGSES